MHAAGAEGDLAEPGQRADLVRPGLVGQRLEDARRLVGCAESQRHLGLQERCFRVVVRRLPVRDVLGRDAEASRELVDHLQRGDA